ncbi:MAG: hypothetical protein PHC95_01240 [Parabacteroides sp.]|nr:hypothetical protein [Parabacteroides sp.]
MGKEVSFDIENPENHIGALEGKAELFDESLAISGMAGPDKQEVRMLVADYNNAGKEGFLSSHIEYAYRTLKYGERVNGEFLFIRSVSK